MEGFTVELLVSSMKCKAPGRFIVTGHTLCTSSVTGGQCIRLCAVWNHCPSHCYLGNCSARTICV